MVINCFGNGSDKIKPLLQPFDMADDAQGMVEQVHWHCQWCPKTAGRYNARDREQGEVEVRVDG